MLSSGQAVQNDGLRSELESIISGLQQYLGDVTRRTDSQRDHYDALLRDHGELARRLEDAEKESREREEQDAQELSQLREVSVCV